MVVTLLCKVFKKVIPTVEVVLNRIWYESSHYLKVM